MTKKITEISENDIRWIKDSSKVGLKILNHYLQSKSVTPDNLDVAFKLWKGDGNPNKFDNKSIACGLGVLFGNYVISKKDCRWIIIDDTYGVELSITSNNSEDTFYPINAVWKRIDPNNEELKFFEPMWRILVEERFLNKKI